MDTEGWKIIAKQVFDSFAKEGIDFIVEIKTKAAHNPFEATVEYTWKPHDEKGIFGVFKAEEIANSAIQANDFMVNMSAVNVPELVDMSVDSIRILAGGRKMNVVAITPVMPGGVPIMYKIQCR